jgi:hypothetical protein
VTLLILLSASTEFYALAPMAPSPIEEAQALASVVEAGSRAILVRELEERIERLEAHL